MKNTTDEHRFYNGTPVQIVSRMRDDYNQRNKPLTSNEEYMDGVIKRMGGFDGMAYSGTTEEERCASFIGSLIRIGVVENLSD